MEMKLPKWLGGNNKRKRRGEMPATRMDLSGTQVFKPTQSSYDPSQTTLIMEDLRRGGAKDFKASWKVPIVGNWPLNKQFRFFGIVFAVTLALAIALIVFDNRWAVYTADRLTTATEMQMLSQRMARGTALTTMGQQTAFAQLDQASKDFRADLNKLTEGIDLNREPSGELDKVLKDIAERWAKMEKSANTIITNQAVLTALSTGVDAINQGNSSILELSEQGAAQLAQAGGSIKDVAFANQLVMLTQRVAKNANALAAGDEIDPETAFLLGKDVGGFRDILQGLLKGNDALRITAIRDGDTRQTLGELERRFKDYEGRVNVILQSMQKLVAAKQAIRFINIESDALFDQTKQLITLFSDDTTRYITIPLIILLGLLALVCLGILAKLFLDDARARAFASEQENKRNQEAILRLLNEMGNLADGDLTVQATVTEDVTGAIADSINFTIEELRALVKGINSSTDLVTKATQEAQAISNRLYEASQRQSKEIQQASASVLQMAQSINEVSSSAAQSARVAQMSLSAAERGGAAVQDQITGMNEIRTQIQETSKRIKRLGESSLEIGEIVELISDITEQTNVLALNAAIQAASAGEAGRGFTVVAEEVQRLAERSAEATKQIEAIVKTIQADTQDAVAAMEKSTQGVVEGTKLSDAAGQVLQEIGRVSRELAELIQGISTQTQKQSASVSEVTRGMQGILRITEETTEGTKQTNVSIAQLTRLAAELRNSVAGFKV